MKEYVKGADFGDLQIILLRLLMVLGYFRVHKVRRVNKRVNEDPLEKGMATHSSTLAWRIPWTEEPGGL